jgi:hypothetical protein
MIDDEIQLLDQADVQELPENPGPVEESPPEPESFEQFEDDFDPAVDDGIDDLVNERVNQQLNLLASEIQQYQNQAYQQNEEASELEQISLLQHTDPLEAERRRMALAERRVARTFESQYGPQLQASGIAMAVHDARAKYWDEPAEMAPYIENTIIELGLQGQLPNHLVEPVRRLAYGAAALDGHVPTRGAPRTVAAAGAEQMHAGSRHLIPASIRNDAAEFEKHFGKTALNTALREADLG